MKVTNRVVILSEDEFRRFAKLPCASQGHRYINRHGQCLEYQEGKGPKVRQVLVLIDAEKLMRLRDQFNRLRDLIP